MFFFFFFRPFQHTMFFFNGMGGQGEGDVTDVGFYPINVFQLHCNRILARFVIVDITRPVRSQVRASILVIRYFVFPFFKKKKKLSSRAYARKERKKSPTPPLLLTPRIALQRSAQTAASRRAAAAVGKQASGRFLRASRCGVLQEVNRRLKCN